MSEILARLRAALADRYSLDRELGRGGMALVYLADDVKHHRAIAIKVLKPELSAVLGAERFLHEIRVTATLQHPHILQLYDSGVADGLLYYVMPYVDGESLRDRLQREGPLAIDDTIRIVVAVAGALDFAHRRQVVHRDIKPENILLQDGQPLVADFGIALAVSAAAGSRLTETGLSVGTPQYMSPEQAAGERQITARSDIYSLAVVAYESLAGEPPFVGPSTAAVLARTVVEKPRSLRVVRETVPPGVEAAILKALAKVPADRFATAAQFAAALTAPTAAGEVADRPALAHASRWRGRVMGGGVLLGAVLAGVLLGRVLGPRQQPSGGSDARQHTSMVLPDSAPLAFVGSATLGLGRPALALAPDATTLVYVASRGGTTQLYRRRLDARDAEPLRGTEGAYEPFFSPDGQWVGFFVGYELKKVALAGGQPITLAEVSEPAGAAWSSGGRILVALREGTQYAWADASGGELEPLSRLGGPNRTHPQILPGERWVLHGMVGDLLVLTSLESGEIRVLTHGPARPIDSTNVRDALRGSSPRYLPSGHIAYVAGGVIMAVPFDAIRLRTLGPPALVLEGVRVEASHGLAQLAVADEGTLIYASGRNAGVTVPVWRSRDGRLDTMPLPSRRYEHFDLSPDGKRLAMTVIQPSGAAEIWITDLRSGVQTRLATVGEARFPFWWPDSRRLAFTELGSRLPWQPVVVRELPGGGQRDTLTIGRVAVDVSGDGRWMPTFFGSPPGLELRQLPDTGKAFTVDPFPTAVGGVFSPDGRWLGYTSSQSGRYEIYVVAADGSGERTKVSTLGGDEHAWSARGDELVYRNEQRWFAVATPGPRRNEFGRPRLLFEGPYAQVPGRSYDLALDGRVVLLLGPPEQTTNRLQVVTNWFSDIRRRTREQERP